MRTRESVFRTVAARYLLDMVTESSLVDSALTVVGAGLETPAVLALADAVPGAQRREDVVDLVEQAVEQLGLLTLTDDDLFAVRTRTIAADICSGRVDPIEGANRLWSGRGEYGDSTGAFAELIQLVDEWEVNLGARSAIAEQIKNIACGMALGTTAEPR